MPNPRVVDEEYLEALIKKLLQASLAAKLATITAEKLPTDDPALPVVLPVFKDEDWISDFTHGYNNRGSFISYGVETSEPVTDDRAQSSTGRKVTLSAVAFYRKQNNPGTARAIGWRVSRGFRELLQEMSPKPPLFSLVSPLIVSAISPEELQLGQNSSSIYLAAGARFYTTLF